MTKGEINRLGERLRAGAASPIDMGDLDVFRASYGDPLNAVVRLLADRLGCAAAARIKRTQSIVEKLQRPGASAIKLFQMQDIAGCRLIVEDIFEQERQVHAIIAIFEHPRVVDRRQRPSHGYRAVHIIPAHQGKPVEIQVRTILQHLWAQFSERVSDRVDAAIKYGTGPGWAQSQVMEMSTLVSQSEDAEIRLADQVADDGSDAAMGRIREMRHVARPRRNELQWEFRRRFLKIVMDAATIRRSREES